MPANKGLEPSCVKSKSQEMSEWSRMEVVPCRRLRKIIAPINWNFWHYTGLLPSNFITTYMEHRISLWLRITIPSHMYRLQANWMQWDTDGWLNWAPIISMCRTNQKDWTTMLMLCYFVLYKSVVHQYRHCLHRGDQCGLPGHSRWWEDWRHWFAYCVTECEVGRRTEERSCSCHNLSSGETRTKAN